MNANKLFFILLILMSASSYGQKRCNCIGNLVETILKVETNYAGFPAKVTPKNQLEYEKLKQELRFKAMVSNDPDLCFVLLKDYVNYFYDKHFRVEYYTKIDSSLIKNDGNAIRQKYQKLRVNTVEGIWKDTEGTEIAILKQADKTFKAMKLSSTKDAFPIGFVYFTLTENGKNYDTKLYNRKISVNIPAKRIGNLLKIWNFQLWTKADGTDLTSDEEEQMLSWKNNNKGLLFKKLNNDFSYLKIPTFENNEALIQKLVAQNDATIRNTKYLIVDLTGNGGGSSGWVSLIPYLSTNQISQEESLLRVSKENVARKLPDIEPFVTNPIPDEYKKYFPQEIVEKYQKAYKELPTTNQAFYPSPGVSFPLDSVLKFPAKVAVIFDDFCGSSTEYFFYLTKQSKKIVTYGEPTIGMMDYVGMSIPTKLPYPGFSLYIPIEKSAWTDLNPIDKTGFMPQIHIKDKQKNWINYIINDLPNR